MPKKIKCEKPPSLRQKKAFAIALENGGSVSAAMREAGYGPGTSKNPDKLTRTRAWKMLMEKYLPEESLAKLHKEQLRATQITIKGIERIEAPDNQARLKALDTAYKLRGSYAPEKKEFSGGLNLSALLDAADGKEPPEQDE